MLPLNTSENIQFMFAQKSCLLLNVCLIKFVMKIEYRIKSCYKFQDTKQAELAPCFSFLSEESANLPVAEAKPTQYREKKSAVLAPLGLWNR